MLVLELGQALGLLLLFHEVGSEFGYSVFQQFLLLEVEEEYQSSVPAEDTRFSSFKGGLDQKSMSQG